MSSYDEHEIDPFFPSFLAQSLAPANPSHRRAEYENGRGRQLGPCGGSGVTFVDPAHVVALPREPRAPAFDATPDSHCRHRARSGEDPAAKGVQAQIVEARLRISFLTARRARDVLPPCIERVGQLREPDAGG